MMCKRIVIILTILVLVVVAFSVSLFKNDVFPTTKEALSVGDCLLDGLYPDATNCSRFYMCAAFGPVLFQCPAGLHFNPTLNYCDWPEKAKCILPDALSTEGYSPSINPVTNPQQQPHSATSSKLLNENTVGSFYSTLIPDKSTTIVATVSQENEQTFRVEHVSNLENSTMSFSETPYSHAPSITETAITNGVSFSNVLIFTKATETAADVTENITTTMGVSRTSYEQTSGKDEVFPAITTFTTISSPNSRSENMISENDKSPTTEKSFSTPDVSVVPNIETLTFETNTIVEEQILNTTNEAIIFLVNETEKSTNKDIPHSETLSMSSSITEFPNQRNVSNGLTSTMATNNKNDIVSADSETNLKHITLNTKTSVESSTLDISIFPEAVTTTNDFPQTHLLVSSVNVPNVDGYNSVPTEYTKSSTVFDYHKLMNGQPLSSTTLPNTILIDTNSSIPVSNSNSSNEIMINEDISPTESSVTHNVTYVTPTDFKSENIYNLTQTPFPTSITEYQKPTTFKYFSGSEVETNITYIFSATQDSISETSTDPLYNCTSTVNSDSPLLVTETVSPELTTILEMELLTNLTTMIEIEEASNKGTTESGLTVGKEITDEIIITSSNLAESIISLQTTPADNQDKITATEETDIPTNINTTTINTVEIIIPTSDRNLDIKSSTEQSVIENTTTAGNLSTPNIKMESVNPSTISVINSNPQSLITETIPPKLTNILKTELPKKITAVTEIEESTNQSIFQSTESIISPGITFTDTENKSRPTSGTYLPTYITTTVEMIQSTNNENSDIKSSTEKSILENETELWGLSTNDIKTSPVNPSIITEGTILSSTTNSEVKDVTSVNITNKTTVDSTSSYFISKYGSISTTETPLFITGYQKLTTFKDINASEMGTNATHITFTEHSISQTSTDPSYNPTAVINSSLPTLITETMPPELTTILETELPTKIIAATVIEESKNNGPTENGLTIEKDVTEIIDITSSNVIDSIILLEITSTGTEEKSRPSSGTYLPTDITITVEMVKSTNNENSDIKSSTEQSIIENATTLWGLSTSDINTSSVNPNNITEGSTLDSTTNSEVKDDSSQTPISIYITEYQKLTTFKDISASELEANTTHIVTVTEHSITETSTNTLYNSTSVVNSNPPSLITEVVPTEITTISVTEIPIQITTITEIEESTNNGTTESSLTIGEEVAEEINTTSNNLADLVDNNISILVSTVLPDNSELLNDVSLKTTTTNIRTDTPYNEKSTTEANVATEITVIETENSENHEISVVESSTEVKNVIVTLPSDISTTTTSSEILNSLNSLTVQTTNNQTYIPSFTKSTYAYVPVKITTLSDIEVTTNERNSDVSHLEEEVSVTSSEIPKLTSTELLIYNSTISTSSEIQVSSNKELTDTNVPYHTNSMTEPNMTFFIETEVTDYKITDAVTENESVKLTTNSFSDYDTILTSTELPSELVSLEPKPTYSSTDISTHFTVPDDSPNLTTEVINGGIIDVDSSTEKETPTLTSNNYTVLADTKFKGELVSLPNKVTSMPTTRHLGTKSTIGAIVSTHITTPKTKLSTKDRISELSTEHEIPELISSESIDTFAPIKSSKSSSHLISLLTQTMITQTDIPNTKYTKPHIANKITAEIKATTEKKSEIKSPAVDEISKLPVDKLSTVTSTEPGIRIFSHMNVADGQTDISYDTKSSTQTNPPIKTTIPTEITTNNHVSDMKASTNKEVTKLISMMLPDNSITLTSTDLPDKLTVASVSLGTKASVTQKEIPYDTKSITEADVPITINQTPKIKVSTNYGILYPELTDKEVHKQTSTLLPDDSSPLAITALIDSSVSLNTKATYSQPHVKGSINSTTEINIAMNITDFEKMKLTTKYEASDVESSTESAISKLSSTTILPDTSTLASTEIVSLLTDATSSDSLKSTENINVSLNRTSVSNPKTSTSSETLSTGKNIRLISTLVPYNLSVLVSTELPKLPSSDFGELLTESQTELVLRTDGTNTETEVSTKSTTDMAMRVKTTTVTEKQLPISTLLPVKPDTKLNLTRSTTQANVPTKMIETSISKEPTKSITTPIIVYLTATTASISPNTAIESTVKSKPILPNDYLVQTTKLQTEIEEENLRKILSTTPISTENFKNNENNDNQDDKNNVFLDYTYHEIGESETTNKYEENYNSKENNYEEENKNNKNKHTSSIDKDIDNIGNDSNYDEEEAQNTSNEIYDYQIKLSDKDSIENTSSERSREDTNHYHEKHSQEKSSSEDNHDKRKRGHHHNRHNKDSSRDKKIRENDSDESRSDHDRNSKEKKSEGNDVNKDRDQHHINNRNSTKEDNSKECDQKRNPNCEENSSKEDIRNKTNSKENSSKEDKRKRKQDRNNDNRSKHNRNFTKEDNSKESNQKRNTNSEENSSKEDIRDKNNGKHQQNNNNKNRSKHNRNSKENNSKESDDNRETNSEEMVSKEDNHRNNRNYQLGKNNENSFKHNRNSEEDNTHKSDHKQNTNSEENSSKGDNHNRNNRNHQQNNNNETRSKHNRNSKENNSKENDHNRKTNSEGIVSKEDNPHRNNRKRQQYKSSESRSKHGRNSEEDNSKEGKEDPRRNINSEESSSKEDNRNRNSRKYQQSNNNESRSKRNRNSKDASKEWQHNIKYEDSNEELNSKSSSSRDSGKNGFKNREKGKPLDKSDETNQDSWSRYISKTKGYSKTVDLESIHKEIKKFRQTLKIF